MTARQRRPAGAGALSRSTAWLVLAALVLAGAGGEDPAAQYDRLFASHDYGALAERLKHGMEAAPTALPTLAWEQRRVTAGGSVFVGAMYALDLLAAGQGGKDPAGEARTRESAVVVALYTLAAIETDGTRCADAAAPVARRRQFVQILTPAWAELRKLPDESVAADLALALMQERDRAATRPADDYLCRGRTDDIPDSVAGGAVAVAPRFAAPRESAARAAAIRAQLPGLLTEFAARLKTGS